MKNIPGYATVSAAEPNSVGIQRARRRRDRAIIAISRGIVVVPAILPHSDGCKFETLLSAGVGIANLER